MLLIRWSNLFLAKKVLEASLSDTKLSKMGDMGILFIFIFHQFIEDLDLSTEEAES